MNGVSGEGASSSSKYIFKARDHSGSEGLNMDRLVDLQTFY